MTKGPNLQALNNESILEDHPNVVISEQHSEKN